MLPRAARQFTDRIRPPIGCASHHRLDRGGGSARSERISDLVDVFRNARAALTSTRAAARTRRRASSTRRSTRHGDVVRGVGVRTRAPSRLLRRRERPSRLPRAFRDVDSAGTTAASRRCRDPPSRPASAPARADVAGPPGEPEGVRRERRSPGTQKPRSPATHPAHGVQAPHRAQQRRRQDSRVERVPGGHPRLNRRPRPPRPTPSPRRRRPRLLPSRRGPSSARRSERTRSSVSPKFGTRRRPSEIPPRAPPTRTRTSIRSQSR